MPLGKHVRFACVCALLVCPIGVAQQQVQQRLRSIKGVVETTDGTRLPGVDVRVTNVGGGPTTGAGEFNITLPREIEPGSEIEFYVAGWKIANLDDGKIFLPKSEMAVIHIKVSRTISYQQYVFKGLRSKKDVENRRTQP